MLVRIRPGAELTGAEREFVECLSAYPSPGLALIDPQVGDRRLGAVVVTPRGITVFEVKGFRRRQSGLLSLSPSGQWTISDGPLELATESSSGLTDRLEHGVHAVRVALEHALQESRHVCGAVVLVPYKGVVVRPARTALRPGLDVLVANTVDAHELRVYLENFSVGPREWTVDRVLNTCAALDLADLAPTRAALTDDGFPAKRPTPAPAPAAPRPRRVEPPAPPAESTRDGKLAGLVVFGLAVLGLLVVLVMVILALLTDSPSPRTVSDITESTTPAPVTVTHRPAHCWPFQSDC